MKLYNTMSRQLDELQPLEAGVVKLYTCGLTVYSQPHIGNWIGYIYWDILVRTLLADGYTVVRTQNITDVGHLVSDDDSGEDKMEKGARAEGLTAWDVAAKYSAIAEHEGYEMLGLLRPTHLVAATSCIDEQIEFAKVLDDHGYLYRTDDGMYFDTSKLADYGKLARLDIHGLQAGARVDMAGKRQPTDFAVWKFSPVGNQRDMEWDSPWGKGFPGWHLECSVIARETLGDQIDIHTGGIDHIPVHHTNEIAQTESVTGQPFASIWLHNNHLKVDGHKMSKSLGNIYTLSDIESRGYDMSDFRMFALGKHYRTEGNFTWENLAAAHNRLQRWRDMASLRWQTNDTLQDDDDNDDVYDVNGAILAAPHAALEALNNDLDTPGALIAIEQAFDHIDLAPLSQLQQHALQQLVAWCDEVLGLGLAQATPDITDNQKRYILERRRARDDKNWQRSDEIRDELAAQSITLRDTLTQTIWSRESLIVDH
ncbi:MAG: cysteine--tRNA ligase [Candidatus Saccharimonadales bacterium]